MKPATRFYAMLACLLLAFLAYRMDGGPISGGPYVVVLAHESADSDPEFARTLTNLRDGKHAEAIKATGNRLLILDDDDPAIAAHAPFAKRELLWLKAGKLVKRKPCPATADEIVRLIQ